LLRDQFLKTRAGGGTAVYEQFTSLCQAISVIRRACGDQPTSSPRHDSISGRRDNLSDHTRREAVEMAAGTGVVITPSAPAFMGHHHRRKRLPRTGTCKISPH